MTSDRILLLEKLQMKSITLDNNGSHLGVNPAERRLRCHPNSKQSHKLC